MNKAKIVALLILASGLVASLVILKTPAKNGGFSLNSSFQESNNPSLDFESALKLSNQKTNQVNGGESSSNLTDNLAALYAGEVVKNIEADGSFNGDAFNAEGLDLEQLLQTQANVLDIPEYKLSDIKISSDNSVQNQVAYLEGVDMLLKENFGGFHKNLAIALDEFFTKKDATSLNYLVEHIPNYLNGLLTLSAPSLWQTVHLQILNLWQKKLVVYRAILDFNSDPLKTFAALQYVFPIAEEDINLQTVMIKRYEELTSKS
ncbi:MAG: hypothetical protein UY26_C0001G0039 [Candidatus Jorgensenbacteria bacterium GW2011_GWA1_48_13]|uniref:Uncharacterized protein n=2 Tax=Candidatus Joergenseniibacteriota TaxID=1752739 RepID=A0A0G1W9N0_9BACT|nr:MAG: hypothetical protein UY26_C0001G0039 [Candidatus Jorgensenbacteria bacterium GW2011_GWA1_48_13]KKU99400.1 MAG: hypothetical protein UY32_C0001G0035 [Candidatus Jorgensenbacteria bacterium GW2011_GWC1_48_8]KKW15285.1 MAG: hypothetical protein UY55_C0001G0039 [Candidatus Jorgensenbacteria bacterium GW2011_GWB1_50_10]